ncbi:hypothetical protein D3C87_1899170 [compost metagenome]
MRIRLSREATYWPTSSTIKMMFCLPLFSRTMSIISCTRWSSNWKKPSVLDEKDLASGKSVEYISWAIFGISPSMASGLF